MTQNKESKVYGLTIVKLDNELYFYKEESETEISEFFSVEKDLFYFERTARNSKNERDNLIEKFALWLNIPDFKIMNKREFKRFLKINFPYESKFYN